MADGPISLSKRLAAINSASSVIARVVNATVLLWMFQFLLNRIPAEEFAVLPVVNAIMVLAPLFFSFFTGGISRYVVEAIARGDNDRVTAIVSSVFPPLGAMTILFVTGGLLFAANIEHVLSIVPVMVPQARVMMSLLVVGFALQMLGAPFVVGYYVKQRYVELNLLGIGRDLIRIFLLFVFLLGIGPQVIWVVVATVTAEALYTAVTITRSRRMVPQLRLRVSMFDRATAGTVVNFGLWTSLGHLGAIMSTHAATLLLNIFGSAVDVTSYYLGATFYRQIEATLRVAVQPLQPVLVAMNALDDMARIRSTVLRCGRYALWVTLFVATPLAVYADAFVMLYLSETYAKAALVIVYFMAMFPFTSPVALLALTAMATARVRAFFVPAFLAQFAGLLLMVALLVWTELGAVGMALSLFLTAFLAEVLYFWPFNLKLTGLSWRDFFRFSLVPGFTPAISAGVLAITLDAISSPTSWLMLALYGALCSIVYLSVLLVFCLSEAERNDLWKIWQRLQRTTGQHET